MSGGKENIEIYFPNICYSWLMSHSKSRSLTVTVWPELLVTPGSTKMKGICLQLQTTTSSNLWILSCSLDARPVEGLHSIPKHRLSIGFLWLSVQCVKVVCRCLAPIPVATVLCLGYRSQASNWIFRTRTQKSGLTKEKQPFPFLQHTDDIDINAIVSCNVKCADGVQCGPNCPQWPTTPHWYLNTIKSQEQCTYKWLRCG